MAQSSTYREFRFTFLRVLLFWIPGTVLAQDTLSFRWTFDGDIRYRFEHWDNMNALSYGDHPEIGNANDNILLQRIIAGTTIGINNFTFSAHLQDARAFGWSLGHKKEPDAFKNHPVDSSDPSYILNPQEEFYELYDATIRIDSIFKLVSLIAGRQKIAFGDYRIFGPGNWGNTGRWTWDAVMLAIEKRQWAGKIWYGGTKIHDPEKTFLPFTHTEYNGGGMHLHLGVKKYPQAELYFAHKHQGSAAFIRTREINRNWVGFRLYHPEKSAWKYELSYTREFGEESSEILKGSGLFTLLGYQIIPLAWKPCVTFRYSRASGNDPESAHNETFDPVYGAGDRYYGWMNLVKWSNLDDREVLLELYPLECLRIEAKYNRFRIPQPEGTQINGNLLLPAGEQHLGDEFDFLATYDLNEKWHFVSLLGYFMIKKGQTAVSETPGNAFMASLQVLYRFNVRLS